jgi:hypothetical protein
MRAKLTMIVMVVALVGSAAMAAPASAKLPGKLFWRYDGIRADRSPDVLGIAFVNARFAYFGVPKGGLPRCAKAKPVYDDKGQLESGCVRYSHNTRSGAVKVGKLRGSYRKRKLKLAKESYYNATVPKRGTRYAVKLINRGFRGMCGLMFGCTTWREDLVLTKAGDFVRSSSSISTAGGTGTPFVYVGSFPPDEFGTYRVLDRGRIRLAYADGSVKTHTIAVDHDDRDRPSATRAGLLLDDTRFGVASDS